jgi:hypothetical protein
VQAGKFGYDEIAEYIFTFTRSYELTHHHFFFPPRSNDSLSNIYPVPSHELGLSPKKENIVAARDPEHMLL